MRKDRMSRGSGYGRVTVTARMSVLRPCRAPRSCRAIQGDLSGVLGHLELRIGAWK